MNTLTFKPMRGQAYVEYVLIFAMGMIGFVLAMDFATDAIAENRDQLSCSIATHGRAACQTPEDDGDGDDGLPVARFVVTTCTDLTCSFDGTASSDSNGEIVLLRWEFVDATGIGWTPQHTFPSPGDYLVKLTVTDNDGNTDETTRVVTLDPGPQCPPDVDVDSMAAGTILSDQFEGISITTHDPNRHPAMLFDTANPTGGDTDLGAPNADFGGPGIGSGGRAGLPGENSEPQGMVIIISEDGDASDPDDNNRGGQLIFEFAYDADFSYMTFLDVDEAPKNPTVKLYDRDGTLFWSAAAPAHGDNSFVQMNIDQTGVAKVVVDFPGSGSVDGLFFCDEYPTVDPDSTPDDNNGGNESCPADTTMVAKFETSGGNYVYESGLGRDVVSISNATLSGGNWSSSAPISAIVVKGGQGAAIDTFAPVFAGSFSNSDVPAVGNGNTPDISNIKFCTPDDAQDVTENQPPMASFVYTCEGMTCSFDANTSADPDGEIVNIAWEYGDGQRGNAVAVTHTFAGAGTYDVTLTVTDNSGATQDVTQTVTIQGPPEPGYQCEGTPTIGSLSLFSADSGDFLTDLGHNQVIDMGAFDASAVTLIAIPSGGTPKSVVFTVNGQEVQTENVAPYAIAGDSNGTYGAWRYPTGEVTIRATAYASKNGNGQARGCFEVTVTITDGTS